MANAGVCLIKPEFILPETEKVLNNDLVSNKDQTELKSANEEAGDSTIDPPSKRQKLSKGKRKLKGQNKNRGPTVSHDKSVELCDLLINASIDGDIPKCDRDKCNFMHDIDEYLKLKPADIGTVCYNFEISGKCPRGLACRWGTSHITENGKNFIDQEKYEDYIEKGPYTLNSFNKNLQFALRKRNYNFDLAESLVNYNDNKKNEENVNNSTEPKKTIGAVTNEDIIKLKSQEKKKIYWTDKLYLSPLTTVGNLPFRRICKEYGADITCGEMVMCSSLLQGNPAEWALIKKHHTEDLFGVQLCANNPYLLTKCGQLLDKEYDIDFIDLNLGCPIDLVFKMGAGSGLLCRKRRILESCVRNLSDILSIPMTVKTRMGVYKNDPIAHELASLFRDWGASLLTIHGRSREQRYTKSADWAYIRQVASNAAPLPVFGNGDILSYDDYKKSKELAPEVQGLMIGRGALIKPWIFTEIKEQKVWDISSKERLDVIKKYVNYGLEHWGSDTRGVETTRRFLLEWLSFLYRYVPVGILEQPPQKINERPPFYKGRDELETLMASPSASDWIKISEMLLGKVPDGFQFLPKHKANSYQ